MLWYPETLMQDKPQSFEREGNIPGPIGKLVVERALQLFHHLLHWWLWPFFIWAFPFSLLPACLNFSQLLLSAQFLLWFQWSKDQVRFTVNWRPGLGKRKGTRKKVNFSLEKLEMATCHCWKVEITLDCRLAYDWKSGIPLKNMA